MPVYEYECASCGGRFEVTRRFSDPELTSCQLCKAQSVRKVLSPAAFVLKGSGWYATDYAAKKNDEAQKPSSKEDSKPESKPAAACGAGACAAGNCGSKG
ncbi:MAG TPA: zinc ribbon domain-containing protein [Nitrospirota bacterium]|nr:zinc ribbon domain-containing protein [Nitrospirota bacterium]